MNIREIFYKGIEGEKFTSENNIINFKDNYIIITDIERPNRTILIGYNETFTLEKRVNFSDALIAFRNCKSIKSLVTGISYKQEADKVFFNRNNENHISNLSTLTFGIDEIEGEWIIND